ASTHAPRFQPAGDPAGTGQSHPGGLSPSHGSRPGATAVSPCRGAAACGHNKEHTASPTEHDPVTTPSARRCFGSLGLIMGAAAFVASAGCYRSGNDTPSPRSPGWDKPLQTGPVAAPRVEPLKVTSPNGEVEFVVVG